MHRYLAEAAMLRAQRQKELAKEGWFLKIEELKQHQETTIITKVDMPEPFLYVEKMFPEIAEEISNTIVYKNQNTAFLKRLGIPMEVGGVFVRPANAIIVGYTGGKVPIDIVIVHEMLHYASKLLGGNFASFEAEENFAFSKSIGYLDLRGMSRDYICMEYMFPYYAGLAIERILKEPGRPKGAPPTANEQERGKIMAIDECMLMIRQALDEDAFREPAEEEPDRFDFI